MKREQAQALIDNAQYLKGKEVTVRRYNPITRRKEKVKGTVRSFGAFSWKPSSRTAPVEVWANVEVPGSGVSKVRLEEIFKAYPPSYFINYIDASELHRQTAKNLAE